MKEQKYYKMKHIPTGLYFQPHVHRGSHLSKKGKIYQTNTNGVESGNYGHKTFTVWCQKDSQIHKLTKDILVWSDGARYGQIKAETRFEAGVYPKDEAVSHAKSVREIRLEWVDIEEHNKMINRKIAELQGRLL